MAEIVAGFGVPHGPIFPMMVAREGPDCAIAKAFASVRAALEAARPDLIVIFTTDHLNTFFFDNYPMMALGIARAIRGPNDFDAIVPPARPPGGIGPDIDGPPVCPRYTLPSREDVARQLRACGIAAGFDLALVERFEVDHSVIIPLHFMTPGMGVPVIPVFINGHIAPLPAARRCFALGETLRRALESWPEPVRVAVIGSGSFSLEVGGPRVSFAGAGVPHPGWVRRVAGHLEQGAVETLLDEATGERMAEAGNVAGELLDWIAMLGALGGRRAGWVVPQAEMGHAFAAWREEA